MNWESNHPCFDETTTSSSSLSSEASISDIPSVAGGLYQIVYKMSAGTFGEIYQGVNNQTGEKVAMKFEKLSFNRRPLRSESDLLYSLQGAPGIPTWKYFGQAGDHYNVLVMELLGSNLQELLSYCGGRFSVKTVLMLADQMIARLEHVHNHDIIHRDLKPENFLVGTYPNIDTLYLIDYGLSKAYRDPVSLDHIPEQTHKPGVVGTLRYSSINCHLRSETSRRDDLESVAYLLIYFLNGILPWQGMKAKNKLKQIEKVKKIKMDTPIDVLCQECPAVMKKYLTYCRNLRFDESPDYCYLRKLFRQALVELGYNFNFVFDWIDQDTAQNLFIRRAPHPQFPLSYVTVPEHQGNEENVTTVEPQCKHDYAYNPITAGEKSHSLLGKCNNRTN